AAAIEPRIAQEFVRRGLGRQRRSDDEKSNHQTAKTLQRHGHLPGAESGASFDSVYARKMGKSSGVGARGVGSRLPQAVVGWKPTLRICKYLRSLALGQRL